MVTSEPERIKVWIILLFNLDRSFHKDFRTSAKKHRRLQRFIGFFVLPGYFYRQWWPWWAFSIKKSFQFLTKSIYLEVVKPLAINWNLQICSFIHLTEGITLFHYPENIEQLQKLWKKLVKTQKSDKFREKTVSYPSEQEKTPKMFQCTFFNCHLDHSLMS